MRINMKRKREITRHDGWLSETQMDESLHKNEAPTMTCEANTLLKLKRNYSTMRNAYTMIMKSSFIMFLKIKRDAGIDDIKKLTRS